MITIFFGQDENLLKYKIQSQIKPKKFCDCNVLIFDDNIDILLDQINQSSLFGADTIIIQNASFLIDEKLQISPSSFPTDKEIIFSIETKLEKDIIPTWREESKIISCSAFSKQEKEKLVDQLLAASGMNFETSMGRMNFLWKSYDDPYFVKNELEKLIQACDGGTISDEVVDKCLFSYEDENVFKLLSYFLTGNKYECIKLFEDLVNKKYQPMEILQILSGQLFNIWLLSKAFNRRMNAAQIEKELKFSRYQQQMNGKLISSKYDINHLINEMYLLDYNIKHGDTNPYIGVKSFLLK